LAFGGLELRGASRDPLPNGAQEFVTLTTPADRPVLSGTWANNSVTERMGGVDSDGNLLLGRSNGSSVTPYMLCKGKVSDPELSYLGNGMWGKFAGARVVDGAAGGKDVVATLIVRNAYQNRVTNIASFGMMLFTNWASQRAASYADGSAGGATEMRWRECGEVPVSFRFTNVTGKPGRIAPLAVNTMLKEWPVDLPEIASAPTPQSPPPSTPQAPQPSPPQGQSPAPPAPPRPVPPPAGPTTEAPAGGFHPLGKWDVRLDRVENPRDDRLTHVYLTLRNSGTAELIQTQNVWVYLESSDGLEQKSGQGLRALPGYPKLFDSPPPVVRPGKEIRTKFVFDRNEGGSPSKVTVEENGKQAEFEF
jgi:hypothetical protein